MIPQDIIDKILSTARIEEYISKEMQLQKKGVNYIACCPFHNEKTPSFVVSPAKGIFKCYGCGEGGNIFGWVQKKYSVTFPEAVEKLASDYNIEYTKREVKPQEREEAALRESLKAVNNEANIYFIEQLQKHPKAMEYAKSRWSERAIQDLEIGYSPEGWTDMRDHLLKKQYSIKIIDQAGLINFSEPRDDYYDFFRGRITIPIRNKSGAIIGFTARVIASNPNVGKFLNTKATALFSKKDNLFGIYHAQREILRKDKLVLVEGAPDVIRLQQIGVTNSVAPLGTALTDEQIALMSRFTKNIILIPDKDTPGQNAAEKNGVKLMLAGLNVSIMILQGDGKDADEVLLHESDYKRHLEDGSTKDFLFWLAETSIKKCKENQQEKFAAIQYICEVLSHIPSEGMRELYIDKLSNAFKPKKIWLTSIAEAMSKLKNKELKQKSKEQSEIYERFGFNVKNNAYYGPNNKGVEVKWSNFIMEPIAHVRGYNSKRLYTITNTYGQSQTIEIAQEDLVSLSRFRVRTESMGNYLWEGREEEMHRIKRYLYENTTTCDEITQLGWQKQHGFFAWSNGGVIDGEFEPANDIGILTINKDNYYLPAFSTIFKNDYFLFKFERDFSFNRSNDISLYNFCEQYIDVFGDNAKISICFLLATLFRDIIFNSNGSFPLLNIFGPKSTGKTAAAQVLSSFFTTDTPPTIITGTTTPAMAATVARVSNAIVHLDEYKNNLDITKREFLKGLWGGSGRNRLNMDRDKKNEATAVDSGVVITGQEMATADIALFSRIIFLTYSKEHFTKEEQKKFEELKLICNRGLSHLTNKILKYRKQVELSYRDDYKYTSDIIRGRLRGESINDRVLKNWVAIVTIIKTLSPYLAIPINYNDIVEIATQGILQQNNKTRESNELSIFWESIETLVKSKIIIKDVHFKIKALPKPIKLNEHKDKIELNPAKKYILIQYNDVCNLVFKDLRTRNEESIPKDSLKHYLKVSPEFIGTKAAERFKMLIAQNSSMTLDPTVGPVPSITSQCLVFDYEQLKEHYNISFEEEMFRELDDSFKIPSSSTSKEVVEQKTLDF